MFNRRKVKKISIALLCQTTLLLSAVIPSSAAGAKAPVSQLSVSGTSVSETSISESPISETDAARTAYGNILWQYYDIWNTDDVSLSLYSEESIVNYQVYYGYASTDANYQLDFTLKDLDGNGTEELMIGIDYGGSGNASVLDIFTYASGRAVRLLSGAERSHLTLCRDGVISENGSGGAAHNYQSYYTIGSDGKSCDTIGYYYINGDDQTVEDLEGTVTPFDGNYDQYLYQYEEETLSWKEVSESSIAEKTIPREAAGAALTWREIGKAPIYKNGMINNGYEVFAAYCRRTWSEEEFAARLITQDYEGEQPGTNVFEITEQESGVWIGTATLNLSTGEVTEERADGSSETFSVLL